MKESVHPTLHMRLAGVGGYLVCVGRHRERGLQEVEVSALVGRQPQGDVARALQECVQARLRCRKRLLLLLQLFVPVCLRCAGLLTRHLSCHRMRSEQKILLDHAHSIIARHVRG